MSHKASLWTSARLWPPYMRSNNCYNIVKLSTVAACEAIKEDKKSGLK